MTDAQTILAARHRLSRLPAHVWVGISAWVSRLFSALAQFALLRLLLASVSVDEYAAFAIVTGLAAWFALLDFGLGVSTQNRISEARAVRGDPAPITLLAHLLALFLSILWLPLIYFASRPISGLLLGTLTSLDAERQRAIFWLGASCLSVVGSTAVVYRIWYAQQKGYLANIVPAVAALIGLISVYFCTHVNADDRILYAIFFYALPTAGLPALILVVQIFRSDWRQLQMLRLRDLHHLISHAMGYWAFALAAAGALQMDYIVLSRFVNAEEIAVYSIMSKIFGLAFFVYSALLQALWPVLTEKLIQRKWGEVYNYIRKHVVLGLAGMVLFTIVIWLASDFIIRLLAPGRNFHVPVLIVVLFGLYFCLRVWCDTFGTALQAMSKMWPFWLLVPIQAGICVSLQWYMARYWGVAGVLMGLICSFALTVTWALPYIFRKFSVR